jgi:fumarate reductase subunit D
MNLTPKIFFLLFFLQSLLLPLFLNLHRISHRHSDQGAVKQHQIAFNYLSLINVPTFVHLPH